MVDGNAAPERVRELAQAGANEAALAIARLLRVANPRVGRVEALDAAGVAHRHGVRALVVSFTVSGAVEGRFAVVTSEEGARAIARDLVANATTKGDALSKKAVGALTELGNIGASAYLNGIADMVNASCVPSVPAFAIEDAASALRAAFGDAPLLVARVTAGAHEVDLAVALDRVLDPARDGGPAPEGDPARAPE